MRLTRTVLFLLLNLCFFLGVSGQALLGLYTAENTITLIKDNPAFAMNSDIAQINVVGGGATFGGNYLLFNRGIYSFLDSGKAYPNTQYTKNLKNEERYLWANVEFSGPGAAFKYKKKKYGVAITTGVRYLVNADHLDNSVFLRMGANAQPDFLAHDSFTVKNFSFTSQVFREINLTCSQYLHKTEDYSLVAGATIKLLAGAGAIGMGIQQASFSINNNDGIAYNLNGNANFASTAGANRWALTNSPFNALNNPTNNLGIGLDIGLIYYVTINNTFFPKTDYQLRIAASVTDIGGISYSAAPTSGGYSIANENVDYRGVQNNTQQSFGNQIFDQYLKNNTLTGTSNISKFRVGLPTAFRFNADANIVKDQFYINVNAIVNLIVPSANRYANHYVSTLTLTPRYMVREEAEIAMPFSFSVTGQGYLGFVFLAGPFYVGSSSIFNSFISNSFNNIDIYTGLTWRIKPPKPKEKVYMMMK